MSLAFARLRRSRIALYLALLAAVAQLGLASAGTTHQARLLAQGGDALGDVCTVAGFERLGPSGDRAGDPGELPSPQARLADCAVCAALGLLAAPPAPAAGAAPPPIATAQGPIGTDVPIVARFDPLPPSRAPPLVS